jgi:hypothetical protein
VKSPLRLFLLEHPSLEKAVAAALQLPDQHGHDVVALLFQQGQTSGTEEDLGPIRLIVFGRNLWKELDHSH